MIRRVLTTLSVLLGIITVMSAYSGLVSPARFYAIPAILNLAFPYIALSMSVVCLLWLPFDKGMATRLALPLFISISSLKAFFPLNFKALADTHVSDGISIMTYNVYDLQDYAVDESHGNALNAIIKHHPDIVALQECYAIPDINTPGTPGDSIRSLYPYRIFNGTAQGILSKWPVKSLDRWHYDNGYFPYAVYAIETPYPDSPLILINVHMRSIGLTGSDKQLYRDLTHGEHASVRQLKQSLLSKLRLAFIDRAQQADFIHSIVREVSDSCQSPVIVCGDFNDTPLSYAQRTIMGSTLQDAYTHAAFGPAITYCDSRFYFRIDHILYTDSSIRPVVCRRLKEPYSDHLPVMAVFVPDKEQTTNQHINNQ